MFKTRLPICVVSRPLTAGLVVAAALLGSADVRGAVIATLSPTTTDGEPTVWPYDAPIESLVDAANREQKRLSLGRQGDSDGNVLRYGQGFQTAESITVGTISLLVWNVAPNANVQISVYRVPDAGATTYPASPAPADVIFSTVYNYGGAGIAYGSHMLELALSGSDTFTIDPRNGDEGYLIELSVPGITTNGGLQWEATIADTVSPGFPLKYYEDGTSEVYSSARDLIFAFQPVPEPASLALLGMGSLLIAGRRRPSARA